MPYDFSTDAEPDRLYVKGGLCLVADGRIFFNDELLCTNGPLNTYPLIREWIDHNFD